MRELTYAAWPFYISFSVYSHMADSPTSPGHIYGTAVS